MQTVHLPWAMWYETEKHTLTFPDTWDLTVSEMVGGPDIGDAGIRQALAEPIGAPPLRELAVGRRDAAILVDDLTRPTPSYRILPYILEELAAGGLGEDRVRIICAVAAHRSMTRQDMCKKIGADLVERLQVINHNAYDNLEFYGHSSQGIPIWVNREFARSDIKIAAGMITPRGPFFGGGSKLLLPGACGRQTIYANHRYCPNDVFREHLDEAARMVGLSYVVNVLLNPEGEVMGMVAGDPVEAYRHGVSLGKELYRSPVPQSMDVVICNAWPKDTEGTQAGMALVPLHGLRDRALKADGSLVIATASPEGLGFHSVLGPGTLLRGTPRGGFAPGRYGQICYAPKMNAHDVRALYGDSVAHCRTWPEVIARLTERHGASPRVAIFPYGALQYGVADGE